MKQGDVVRVRYYGSEEWKSARVEIVSENGRACAVSSRDEKIYKPGHGFAFDISTGRMVLLLGKIGRFWVDIYTGQKWELEEFQEKFK